MGKIRSVVSALLILLSFSCWANMLQEKKTSFENLCELSVVDPHVLLSKADTLDVHSALPFIRLKCCVPVRIGAFPCARLSFIMLIMLLKPLV